MNISDIFPLARTRLIGNISKVFDPIERFRNASSCAACHSEKLDAIDGVHFFTDDRRFARYIIKEKAFDEFVQAVNRKQSMLTVLMPDTSINRSMPLYEKLYRIARTIEFVRRLCDACDNVQTVPTLIFDTDEEHWSYIASLYEGSRIIAVSSYACLRSRALRRMFVHGLEYFVHALEFERILLFGKLPTEVRLQSRTSIDVYLPDYTKPPTQREYHYAFTKCFEPHD